MNKTQKQYLQAMKIQLWQEKNAIPAQSSQTFEAQWQALEKKVSQCTLCELSQTRTKSVFGVGCQSADLLLIGEAPGAHEDRQGLPFVGRAGQLLNSILQAVGFQRDEVYIANVLKCRPPNNREPAAREVECCTPYLNQQIELLQPKLIVAVGRVAAQFLLETRDSLGSMRNTQYTYGEYKIPVLVTYHPAYLLRSPKEKAKSYLDWQRIRRIFDTL